MSQSENNPYPHTVIDMGSSPHHDAMARRIRQIAIARAYYTRLDNNKQDNQTGLPEFKRPVLSK